MMIKNEWVSLPEFENFEGTIGELYDKVSRLKQRHSRSGKIKFDRVGKDQHLMLEQRTKKEKPVEPPRISNRQRRARNPQNDEETGGV